MSKSAGSKQDHKVSESREDTKRNLKNIVSQTEPESAQTDTSITFQKGASLKVSIVLVHSSKRSYYQPSVTSLADEWWQLKIS